MRYFHLKQSIFELLYCFSYMEGQKALPEKHQVRVFYKTETLKCIILLTAPLKNLTTSPTTDSLTAWVNL